MKFISERKPQRTRMMCHLTLFLNMLLCRVLILDATTDATSAIQPKECVANSTNISESCIPYTRPPRNDSFPRCTLYLAKSTIPNAGLGVFTSIFLPPHTQVGHGDLAVPLVDMDHHNDGYMYDRDYHWMITEYDWQPHMLGIQFEMEGESVSGIVPGLGSLVNSHLRLNNIREDEAKYNDSGVRRGDAAAGAFTYYIDRTSLTMEQEVVPGQELFVSYGTEWFLNRESKMGLIPFNESYAEASTFMAAYGTLLGGLSSEISNNSHGFETDLWQLLRDIPYESRARNALPKTPKLARRAIQIGIDQTEKEQSIVPLSFLEKYGKCLDNLRPGKSTIPHAGQGAFATRFLPQGSMIAPAPLFHIPDRNVLTMYESRIDAVTGLEYRDLSKPMGYQLLLNYCFGHNSSSLLLCPYGSGTWYINHNHTSPNAKIVWSDDDMYHDQAWLTKAINPHFDRESSSKLALEYVALRDIREGEEVTIDYGSEWDKSWNAHVANWTQSSSSSHEKSILSFKDELNSLSQWNDDRITPQQLNADGITPLRTIRDFPKMYGNHINIRCQFSKESIQNNQHVWEERRDWNGTDNLVRRILDKRKIHNNNNYQDHNNTNDSHNNNNNHNVSSFESHSHVYTLELLLTMPSTKKLEPYVISNVPRKAIAFYYDLYQSDIHIRGAFRHEMMIPDDMFPSAWKDLTKL